MKVKKLKVFMALLFVLIISGCGSSGSPDQIVTAEQFRLLQLGDTWTYSETSVYTPPGGAAPLAFLYTHTVTVVNQTDPTGRNYLALQHDFTPAPGTPPLGTEWDLFTQNPTTREVKLVGNITPSGQFIAKGNTLFAGAYFHGLTYKNDWDVSDNIVTFNSVVLGKTRTTTEITIPGGYQKLDTWVVESVEIFEPGGQNVFDQGYMTAKINPTVGNVIEFDASFSAGIPGTIGQRGEISLHSDLLATNVPLNTPPVNVTVRFDSSNYTPPPTGAEQFRLLQLGDAWTYSQTSVYTPPGGAAPLAFLYTHTVTVVNQTDPTGRNYLALQHDFTPAPGTPPLGTEWDLFTQDPTTREVKLVGNITPSGQFIAKGNTLFAGVYFHGLTYKNDWDVSDSIVTFNSKVLGKTRTTTEITIPGGFLQLDTWVVESVEISEPGGQNVFDQGYMTAKINPTVGNAIEFDASFSAGIPGTIGQRGKISLHSDLLATNVPIP